MIVHNQHEESDTVAAYRDLFERGRAAAPTIKAKTRALIAASDRHRNMRDRYVRGFDLPARWHFLRCCRSPKSDRDWRASRLRTARQLVGRKVNRDVIMQEIKRAEFVSQLTAYIQFRARQYGQFLEN